MRPKKSESPAATGLNAEQNTNAPIVDESESEAERKRFATLAARAALAGHTLSTVKTGYMLSRWNQTRHFIDLDSAEALIARMEGGRS